MDLNLLVSLDALLAECNVTRAAERLHISQPALSAQLAKLRLVFNDQLLLPAESGRGMTSTARALALRGPLRSALENLGAVIRSAPAFDPFKDTRTFQVAIGDNATAVMGLPLIERLAANAGENVHIALSMSEPQRIAVHMEEGEIALLIDAERIVPGGVNKRVLLEQPFVMAQRKGHPRGTAALDLDTYCGLRHIVASGERGIVRGYMDEHLETLGRRRNTVLSIPQVMMVPDILRTSDYVCTLPRMLLSRFSGVVDIFELPFPAERFTLAMAWHPRNDADPAVTWLRDLVIRVAASCDL
ncbi:MAG: LysR family transcriptional regulator [Telluria sp.]|nr:LysR family transcriptional regulator [Telluria sp.]